LNKELWNSLVDGAPDNWPHNIRKLVIKNPIAVELRELIINTCPRLGIEIICIASDTVNISSLEENSSIVAYTQESEISVVTQNKRNGTSSNNSNNNFESTSAKPQIPLKMTYSQREASHKLGNWLGVLGLSVGANNKSIKKEVQSFLLEF